MQRLALVGLVLLGAAASAAGQPPDATERPAKASAYSAVGWASWYGREFHGRRTADGETFDMGGLTAAHKTMPLPCYARVTNLRNGRSMVVRINDRGPFVGDRVIDVSARVANLLDFQRSGLTKVKVDFVGMAPIGGGDEPVLLASLKSHDSPDDGVSAFAPTRPAVIAARAPAPAVIAARTPVPAVVAAYAPTPAPTAAFAESAALAAANRLAQAYAYGPARSLSLETSPASRDAPPRSLYGDLVPSAYGDIPPWPAGPAASPALMAEIRR